MHNILDCQKTLKNVVDDVLSCFTIDRDIGDSANSSNSTYAGTKDVTTKRQRFFILKFPDSRGKTEGWSYDNCFRTTEGICELCGPEPMSALRKYGLNYFGNCATDSISMPFCSTVKCVKCVPKYSMLLVVPGMTYVSCTGIKLNCTTCEVRENTVVA